MAIKFGTSQVSNPTPSNINLWVRVYTVVAGVFLGWMVTSPLIGPHTQNTISSILGLSLALVNGIAPLFGIDISGGGGKKVDVDKVTAMEPDATFSKPAAPNDNELKNKP